MGGEKKMVFYAEPETKYSNIQNVAELVHYTNINFSRDNGIRNPASAIDGKTSE